MNFLQAQWLRWVKASAVVKDACAGALILASACLAARPLFVSALIAHEDTHSTLIRTVGLAYVWQDGQILGRWLPDINFGYGYPLLNFYAPLFSYMGAVLSFLTRDPMLAVNLVLILGFILSGWVMYLFARDHWGRAGGLLSAMAYLWVPYHACEIYRRSAHAESLAFVFVPLIAWRFRRLLADMKPATFLAAVLSVAGLVLCHNVMTLLFMPVAAAYVLFLIALDPVKAGKKILVSAGVACAALGVTAYFWLPAMVEKQYVMIHKIYEGAWDYHHHFMTLRQFIFSPWECGSISWTNGVSFQLGMTHFLLALGAAAAVLLAWRSRGRRALHFLFWLVMGILIAFLTLKSSVKVWEAIPVAKYVQYPWRLFLILSFILSFLAGGIVAWGRGMGRVWIALAGIAVVIVFNSSFAVIDKTRVFDLKDRGAFLFNARPMDNMEYLPRWVKSIPLVPPKEPFVLLRGEAAILEHKRASGVRRELTIAAKTPALVCFQHFYFPGWKVLVDDKAVEIFPDNPYGLIVFAVPPGLHHVKVIFGQTPVRTMADAVSVVFILLIAGLGLLVLVREKKDIRATLFIVGILLGVSIFAGFMIQAAG